MIDEIIFNKKVTFGTLKGLTLASVEVDDESVLFRTINGGVYGLAHDQDCCEHVCLDDIAGDLEDLLGEPIEVAHDCSSAYNLPQKKRDDGSYTWTFYRLATRKGWVVFRFYGTSNGYYSETADLYEIHPCLQPEQVGIVDYRQKTKR